MNTPLRIRAAAFTAALALTFVLLDSLALYALPPDTGDTPPVALALVSAPVWR